MLKQLFILVMISSLLLSCNDKDVSSSEAPANTATTFNVGMTYIQLPNTYDNNGGTITEEFFPNPCEAGLGGTWEIRMFDGAFFRAEGGASALPFNGGVDTDGDETIDVPNRGAIQADAFQGHRHGVGASRNGNLDGGEDTVSRINEGGYDLLGGMTLPNNAGDDRDLTDYSIPDNTAPRASNETRPLNYTIRVWQKMLDTGFTCALYETAYDVKIIEKQVITKDKNGNVIKTEMVVDRVEKTPRMTSDGQKILKEIASYDEEEQAELVKEFDTKRQKVFIDKNAADITSKEISPKVKIIIQD